MQKLLVTIGLSLCLLGILALPRGTQSQNTDWIEVSPAGESFSIEMPNQPRLETDGVSAFSGNRYTVPTGPGTYTVWSLTNHNYKSDEDTDVSLDATAELLWEKLLLPDREKLDEKDRKLAAISYVRELPPEGLPGREYSLLVGLEIGKARIFVAREHIYILLVMQHPGRDCPSERFFASFRSTLNSPASVPVKPPSDAGTATSAVNADENHVFSGREVTSKVRILEKPEPTYTDSARKFAVTGTVILRAVFAKDGEVTNLQVLRKLPHGLTEQSINAARVIKFTPATKDGLPVSMWMQLEYNFSIY
jgi:Gram-negative bacterial TonB protein C-terminal